MKFCYTLLFLWFSIVLGCDVEPISQSSELVSTSIKLQREFANEQFRLLLEAQRDKMRDPYVAVKLVNWNEITLLLENKRLEVSQRFNSIYEKLSSENRNKLSFAEAGDISIFLSEVKMFFRDVMTQADFNGNNLEKSEVLAKATNISSEFLPEIRLNTTTSESIEGAARDKIKELLLHSQVNDLTLVMICIENDFFRACYLLMQLVFEVSSYHSAPCEMFVPIVSVNSFVFSKGDTIEISAGIGNFGNVYRPSYFVGGKKIDTKDESSVMFYRARVPMREGKFSIPLRVEYLQPDGNKSILTKQINYEVR